MTVLGELKGNTSCGHSIKLSFYKEVYRQIFYGLERKLQKDARKIMTVDLIKIQTLYLYSPT
jgi:hypothetical protein